MRYKIQHWFGEVTLEVDKRGEDVLAACNRFYCRHDELRLTHGSDVQAGVAMVGAAVLRQAIYNVNDSVSAMIIQSAEEFGEAFPVLDGRDGVRLVSVCPEDELGADDVTVTIPAER